MSTCFNRTIKNAAFALMALGITSLFSACGNAPLAPAAPEALSNDSKPVVMAAAKKAKDTTTEETTSEKKKKGGTVTKKGGPSSWVPEGETQ